VNINQHGGKKGRREGVWKRGDEENRIISRKKERKIYERDE
jgi:hypothetical protein